MCLQCKSGARWTYLLDLREEFGIEPGDQVSFVRTEEGILIAVQESAKIVRLRRLLDEMKDILQETEIVDGKSYTLEELIESGLRQRSQILKEKYGLDAVDG